MEENNVGFAMALCKIQCLCRFVSFPLNLFTSTCGF